MWATHFIIVIKQCAATQQLHVSLLLLLQVDFAPTPGCKLGLCVSLSWKMAVMLSSVLQVPSMSDWHWECANLENKQQKAGRRKGSVRKIINCSNNKGFVQKKKRCGSFFYKAAHSASALWKPALYFLFPPLPDSAAGLCPYMAAALHQSETGRPLIQTASLWERRKGGNCKQTLNSSRTKQYALTIQKGVS